MNEELLNLLKDVRAGRTSPEKAAEILANPGKKYVQVKVTPARGKPTNVKIPVKVIRMMAGIINNMPQLKRNNVDVSMILEAVDKGMMGEIVDFTDESNENVKVMISL